MRRQLSLTAKIEPIQKREIGLTILAIILGDASIGFLVLGTLGVLSFPVYRDAILLPSVIVVAAIAIYTSIKSKWLGNRIVTGLWAGALATLALEAIRVPGYAILHWLPGDDMIMMPGLFLIGMVPSFPALMQMMQSGASMQPMAIVFIVGGLYHFWNGAVMGCTYSILVGKARWHYGLVWGFIVHIGMMLAPWLVMMFGAFGLGYAQGYNIFTMSLLAHLAWGTVLGILVQRFVKDKYSIIAKLRARRSGLQ